MAIDARPRARIGPALVLAGAAVLAQICYPLVSGPSRDRLTVLIVVLFAAASLAHALQSRGRRAALALVGAGIVFGFLVEVVGLKTGLPFGRYEYAATLGPKLVGVPVVIGLAWTMLAWPAALVARRLVRSFPARVALGAWALASWDVYLDPQMVAAGHWHWRDPSPHLPGVPGVPISDYIGWLAVATVISYVLQRVLRTLPAGDDQVPYGLYVWTWASAALALAAFLNLAGAALWGAIAMGTVAVPLLLVLRRER